MTHWVQQILLFGTLEALQNFGQYGQSGPWGHIPGAINSSGLH